MDPEATVTETAPVAAPVVDQEAITANAVKQATAAVDERTKAIENRAAEIADARVKSAFKRFAGEEEAPKVNPLLEAIVKDPESVLGTVMNRAVEKAKAEMKADQAQQTEFYNKGQAIATPFMEDYPQIKEHLDYVEANIQKELAKGSDFETACKDGFENSVKKLQLKSAKQLAEDRRINNAMIPSVGATYSAGGPKEFNNAKSTLDYVNGLQAKVKELRGRK
jgi:hypothetical protein